eukprot:TRINITY_DN1977_c0_g1_i2.p1 TRINITY_DN1977_c0_g1~~TRINITY_DN1977_c0_g1_i2.p1  ORF type:complete len:177 (+),score=44.36 TRINITY_DN1977_c0_g1_i2:160-690(+)
MGSEEPTTAEEELRVSDNGEGDQEKLVPEIALVEQASEEPPNHEAQAAAADIHEAGRQGQHELISLVAEHAPQRIDEKDVGGATPLYWAVFHRRAETITSLLQAKADVHQTRELGRTMLHICSQWGKVNEAQALITGKADVNAQLEDGRTPLALAMQYGRREIFKTLQDAGGTETV